MNAAYRLAQADLGTWEWSEGHNPKVVRYFHDVGHEWVQDDETAWCAAFVGAMLKRAGMAQTGQLDARSYLDWGAPVGLDDAQEGDIVVFWRESPTSWKGHVGFFVSRTQNGQIRVLGGNQADQVNISTYSEDRLLGVRRSPHAIEPEPVTPKSEQAGGGLVAAIAGIIGAAVGIIGGWLGL